MRKKDDNKKQFVMDSTGNLVEKDYLQTKQPMYDLDDLKKPILTKNDSKEKSPIIEDEIDLYKQKKKAKSSVRVSMALNLTEN